MSADAGGRRAPATSVLHGEQPRGASGAPCCTRARTTAQRQDRDRQRSTQSTVTHEITASTPAAHGRAGSYDATRTTV